jgi:hypothetical protein
MLSEREVFDLNPLEILAVGAPAAALDAKAVNVLLSSIAPLTRLHSDYASGDLRDYSSQQLQELSRAIERIRTHAFYELRTNAVSAMLRGDASVALVLACAALEGAHGAFLSLTLRPSFPDDKFDGYLSQLLREHGFFSLVQLSVWHFMSPADRPTAEDMTNCLKGVEIRNAIMHAGRKKGGRYKLREYSQPQLQAGYSGIMAVYRALASCVERMETQSPPSPES